MTSRDRTARDFDDSEEEDVALCIVMFDLSCALVKLEIAHVLHEVAHEYAHEY